jgi:hypothetical protein
VTTKETDAVGTAVGVVGAVADGVGANDAADTDEADAVADFLGTAVVALVPFADVDDADA